MADYRRTGPIDYRHRIYGQAGGYGQTGPGLNYGGDELDIGAPYRVPPSAEFPGYHFGPYEARHYGRRSETERGRAGPMRSPGMIPYEELDEASYRARLRAARDNRGRGPRGYVRRDARIAEDINER